MVTFEIENSGRYRAEIHLMDGGTYVRNFQKLDDDLRDWVRNTASEGQILKIYDTSNGVEFDNGTVTTPSKIIEITSNDVN